MAIAASHGYVPAGMLVILLAALILLSLVALALVGGSTSLLRARRTSKNRFRNFAAGLLGLAIAVFLTYPFVLGPAIAVVACHSDVGLQLHEQVDLSQTGYEIDSPPGTVRFDSGAIHLAETPEGTLFRRGVDDVISRRVAFIETASSDAGGLHRISLGSPSSPHCVVMQTEFAPPLALPPGSCLQLEPIR